MKALDRKVFRDLKLLWSQAVTIALVVASGIGGFVGCLSAVESLSVARERFYEAGRFADVFASVKRAPEAQARRLAELPGVVDVQTTVEAGARITVADSTDPVIGQLIGLDSHQPQRLNRVSLRSGRLPEPGSRAGGELDAVVTEVFAQAHKLTPGSSVTALVNGKLRRLRITGTVLSPEYIFAGMWGMPDVRAFGVFWLDADELAAALDMQGAFNRVALKLAPGTSQPATIDAVNRQLARFGGLPAIGRDDQMSHAILNAEIREQQVLGTILPSIFLAVAAFLLHVVTARLVATQREQVAALKALGYPNRAIALHYLKLVTPMAAGGWLLGLGLAQWLGRLLMGLYDEVFRFPVFALVMPSELVAASLGIVAVTALLGTLTAIAATVRLQPAEAMRPPAPGRYQQVAARAHPAPAHRPRAAHDPAQHRPSPAARGGDGGRHRGLGGDHRHGQLLPRCHRRHRRHQLQPGHARRRRDVDHRAHRRGRLPRPGAPARGAAGRARTARGRALRPRPAQRDRGDPGPNDAHQPAARDRRGRPAGRAARAKGCC